jgi:hypothetical protein
MTRQIIVNLTQIIQSASVRSNALGIWPWLIRAGLGLGCLGLTHPGINSLPP